ncbi:hypothetical protein [Actinomadura flavalba]|uniref:hypothetical protein n=1 Tax=Actinomadura flavalba TaxID=1120938 RepID=UPI0003747E75|nr:hypothetical protein [Actinomadura flavalba]
MQQTSPKRAVLVAAMLAVPFVLGACAGETPSQARPAPLPSVPEPEPEPLTPQVAEREFRTYTASEDVARAAGDSRLALSWVSDGQAVLTAAEFRRAAFDGDAVRRYTYGKPRLYVPKLRPEGEQWFVAAVPRTVEGEPKSTRTALMAFMKRGVRDDWRLSLTTVLAPKAKAPKIVVDDEGYAEPLATTDSSVLIRPREVPGIQATMASEGPDSIAARVMKQGPVTSGYYKQTTREARKAREKKLSRQVVFVATPYPYFSLRTEHGGGLVLYSLMRNSVTRAEDANAPEPVRPPVTREIAHLLDDEVEGTQISVTETFQYAAADPGRAKTGRPQPKADVIAHTGAPVKAHMPRPAKNP